MNLEKLFEAEIQFFNMYPKGFDDPEMEKIKKKHKLEKMSEKAHEVLSKESLNSFEKLPERLIKFVNASSLISVFEKPKFRDTLRVMTDDEKKDMAIFIKELIHGDEEGGFNGLLELLQMYKMGKWTILSVFRCYYYPKTDLIFKPTTVKNVINKYELKDLIYKPKPSYDFYVNYRKAINEMKKYIQRLKNIDNSAFSGFLMMTM